MGANCSVVGVHKKGTYAFIGCVAVVTNDMPYHALMVGNPARQIGWMCKGDEKLNSKFCCPVCKKKYKKTKTGLYRDDARIYPKGTMAG